MEKSRKLRTFLSPIPPLGLTYIAALLEGEGADVRIIDQVAGKNSNRLILKKIKEYSPDMIGFSCLTSVMTNVGLLAAEIKKFTKAPVVLGNIHPTIFAEQVLRQGIADIVVRGEGEVTMLELLKAIKLRNSLSGVKGISYRDNGQTINNPARPLIEDLDTLPYPAWHLIDFNNYKDSPMILINREPVIPIAGSRGCPFQCLFCAQDTIYPKPRYRKISLIIKELEYLHSRFNIRNFGFVDANFPFSSDSGIEFCNELMRSGIHNKIKWATETRVDLVSEELLVSMKKAGVHLIMFGFEVGNDKIMSSTDKRTSLAQARNIVKITKKLKINTLGLFILGLPGETKETCEDTIKFAKELDCDIAKFNIAIPYPGSRFFNEFYKEKKDFTMDTDKFTPWHDWSDSNQDPVYVPEGLTGIELIGLQRKAMFDFYARPHKFIHLLISQRQSIHKVLYGAFILASKYYSYVISRFLARIF